MMTETDVGKKRCEKKMADQRDERGRKKRLDEHTRAKRVMFPAQTPTHFYGPGVAVASEPMGGSTGAPTATARTMLPILGTTMSSRRDARTASPLPLRGRVAAQLEPKLYPSGAESLRARARRCLFPSTATPPLAPALDAGGGGIPPAEVRCRLRPWASSKSMGTGEGEVP